MRDEVVSKSVRAQSTAADSVMEEEEEEGEGEGTAKKAWVLAVYEDQNKREWKFQRT